MLAGAPSRPTVHLSGVEQLPIDFASIRQVHQFMSAVREPASYVAI
jgi:hypothetical protein